MRHVGCTASSKMPRIISGGQTGADRAALDFAIKHGIGYGGWVPRGRKAEDGMIPRKYRLREMSGGEYAQRTKQNILDSDGTLILSHGRLTGGSALTKELAVRHDRPYVHVDLETMDADNAAIQVRKWIDIRNIRVLNVAGPRASIDPRIHDATMTFLEKVMSLA